MEDLNQNLNVTQSPSSTQNEPQTTKEELVHAISGENTAAPEAFGVDSTSDSGAGAKSEAEGSGQGAKRGRGRPRKYEVAGNELSPVPVSVAAPPGILANPLESPGKRSRGRPRGSGKLQILASIGGYVAETAGGSFTPHVLTVEAGQDVVGTILTFFQRGSRAVCVLSATGPVACVVLRQPGVGAGFLRYEGRFEILSLTGSCTYAIGPAGTHIKSGMLCVSLAKPDGRVFGGEVESSLIAANPIQLVLATFKQNISNLIMKRNLSGSSSTAPNMPPGNPDSGRDQLKVPKLMIEGEQSCPSPTATTTNGVADNVIPETTNGVSDNVITTDHNMQSDPVSGIDLDCQTLQPVIDQTTSADVDASVPQT